MLSPPVPKKDVALHLLESSLVQFHLDPRKEGVVLPPHLRTQPQVVLDIGLNLPVPIRDLDLTEEAMSCTLSFNRTPVFCVLPWTAVFAMVTPDGRAAVWPEDVPPGSTFARALADLGPQAESGAAEPPKAIPLQGRSGRKKNGAVAKVRKEPAVVGTRPAAVPLAAVGLRAVEAVKEPAAPSRGKKSKRPLPPYLRVVK